MISPDYFRALRPGPVEVHGRTWSLTVHDLGVLRVPSGRLEACDPFVTLGEAPVFDVSPGDYPVHVTVADVSEAQRTVAADGRVLGIHIDLLVVGPESDD